jgi:hypothetical protein
MTTRVEDMQNRTQESTQQANRLRIENESIGSTTHDLEQRLQQAVLDLDLSRQDLTSKSSILREVCEVLAQLGLPGSGVGAADNYLDYAWLMPIASSSSSSSSSSAEEVKYRLDKVVSWVRSKLGAVKRIRHAFETTIRQVEQKWQAQYNKIGEEADKNARKTQNLAHRVDRFRISSGLPPSRFVASPSRAFPRTSSALSPSSSSFRSNNNYSSPSANHTASRLDLNSSSLALNPMKSPAPHERSFMI